jgi:hypothetical protein
MNTYTKTYKVTTTTGNGAKCIHTFSDIKEARQLMSEQSYFAHEMEAIHADTEEQTAKPLMPSDRRHGEYNQGVRNCFGFYARNAAQAQDKLAEQLVSEGFTHIYNMFGSHPIKTDWRGFAGRQMAANAMRVN